MINQLDLRRLASAAVFALLIVPAGVLIVLGSVLEACGSGLSRAAAGIWRLRSMVSEWANPDVHGKAPRRCRRLLYSRSTVERLVATNESLRRQLGERIP